jgi:hypothetical protein
VLALIEKPIFVYKDQLLNGRVRLVSNKRQSYDVEIEIQNPTTGQLSTNVLDLKNPCFHYTGQQIRQAPGTYEQSPSQQLWSTIDQQQQQQQIIQPQSQLVSINTLSDNVMNCVVNGTMQQTVVQELDANATPLTMQPLSSQLNYIAPNNVVTDNHLIGNSLINQSMNNSNNRQTAANKQAHQHNNGTYFNQQLNSVYNTSTFPVNNGLMIGDYVANNLLLPEQNSFK